MNTNMFIQDTISEFNDIGYSIDDIFFESAMEADNIIDDDTNKENFAKKLLVTVEKLINEIFAIIDRFISNVKNIFTRIAQTDTGFRDHCRRAMVKNKPLEAIKLITYDYNDNYLEDQMNKMTRECISILTSLKTEYQKENGAQSEFVLDMEKKKDIVQYILKKIGCDDRTTDINLYFEELKKNFRVQKKEILFKASLGNQYYHIATGIDKIESIAKQKQSIMKNQANVIKSDLMNITKNKTTQNDVKRRAVKFYKHAAGVYNFYTSFLKIYIQFKLERALTYRVVLKKLFHFQ